MNNREEFLAMIDKVESGDIDVIVVFRLDRFSRDTVDSQAMLKLLNKCGCTLLAGDTPVDNKTALGELYLGIGLNISQYHARNTANRVMHGEIHNVQKGDCAGGQPPYGLKIVNKQYEIDEDEAPAVRLIFSMTAKRK